MTDNTADIVKQIAPEELNDHNVVPLSTVDGVGFEKRPARTADGAVVEGLYNAWITLDNPKQFNSYIWSKV